MRQLLLQLELLWANRRRLEAKLFGAGRVMPLATDIEGKNAAFMLRQIREEGVRQASRQQESSR